MVVARLLEPEPGEMVQGVQGPGLEKMMKATPSFARTIAHTWAVPSKNTEDDNSQRTWRSMVYMYVCMYLR